MKVGDVVKVKESHWHNPGLIGIIIHDLNDAGRAFKVLLSSGEVRPKMASNLEMISESR